MFLAIVQHTPPWVWAALLALLALGLRLSRPATVSLRRSTLMPLVLLLLSLAGVVTRFGTLPAALLAWAVGLAATLLALHGRIDLGDVRFDPATRSFALPGSWLPLALMMALFAVKFAVGVLGSIRPPLLTDAALAMPASAAFGAVSGVFLARAVALWTLAGRALRTPALAARP